MKQYQGISVSPGLVLGQVSLLKRETYLFNRSQYSPEKEQLVLEEAVRIAQNELDSMAGRSAASEQAIFTFQSMLLEDDAFMGEVRSYIQAGTGAAEAMNRVGQRYADKLLAMTDNAYLQLRNVDILDVTQRVVNILAGRPRVLLTLDHPVILAADKLMPSDLFSIPSGMILGIITSEGSSLSHAAIIARARRIPSIIQVGRDFLDDCDGRIVVLDADEGSCILDPDANTRQQTVSRICARQQVEEDELETPVRTMPCLTRDGAGFELLANCFGPEDIESALSLGAAGVGLLRSDYQILAGNTFDEQEQYYYYAACIAAAKGKPITVRTFDFGSDRTLSNVYKGDQSAHLGMRGIRSSLRNPRRFENQIRALLRAGTIGPLRIVFPMVTNVSDWDEAMRLVQHCRSNLEERGVPYKTDVPFGIMLSIPAACLTAEDFVKHGCEFFVIGTNDIGIAVAAAPHFDYAPVVFAKKSKSKNLDGELYTAQVTSFTRGTTFDVQVSKKYLQPGDRVLIIDDFLAKGQALLGLLDIVAQSGAEAVGCGIVIEKGFQEGGKMLRERGVRLESLAIIDKFEDGRPIFRQAE